MAAELTRDDINIIKQVLINPSTAQRVIDILQAAVNDGPGTVTNVTSANTDIGVQNPTTTPTLTLNKDNTGGVVGLTLLKINFKNVLNTFTSFFTNSNTAARTYTFPDATGTIALLANIPPDTTTYLKSLSGYADNPALALHPDGAGGFAWS